MYAHRTSLSLTGFMNFFRPFLSICRLSSVLLHIIDLFFYIAPLMVTLNTYLANIFLANGSQSSNDKSALTTTRMASSNIADPPPSHPAQSLPDYSWPTDTLGSALPAVQDDLDADENIFFQKALLEFAALFGLRQISTVFAFLPL